MPEPPKDRPGWSITWLLRIQRRSRDRARARAARGTTATIGRLFPWAVLLILLIEVALLVWMGILPRQ